MLTNFFLSFVFANNASVILNIKVTNIWGSFYTKIKSLILDYPGTIDKISVNAVKPVKMHRSALQTLPCLCDICIYICHSWFI